MPQWWHPGADPPSRRPEMQKITPFLWFDTQGEEAAKFYISIFRNSKITGTTRYGEAGPGPKGSVLTGAANLDGRGFGARKGGPPCKFTQARPSVAYRATAQTADAAWEQPRA